ncbi:hypothetical protein KI809_02115 [Geobacter pelophilus]|uniref:Thioredoxin domain-containing protein n=2 Tax=Geoanaerobacter pelophilus TaxID=60036 RepID=A0AAW4L275_9BACT|nr:hypothetical protein [Geoanaerobacter pelophilus]
MNSSCASHFNRIIKALVIFVILLSGEITLASEHASSESKCASDAVQSQYSSSGACISPNGISPLPVPEGSLQQLFLQQSAQETTKNTQRTAIDAASQQNQASKKVIIYFFWGNGCPHCEEERQFLDELRRVHPYLEIWDYEVWHNKKNAGLMSAMLQAHGVKSSGVPVTFVGDKMFSGFTEKIRLSMVKTIEKCSLVPCGDPGDARGKTGNPELTDKARPFNVVTTATDDKIKETEISVSIPFLGELDSRNSPLPVLTLIIAAMDSFNPCAFFVLLTLLGLLVHAQSRKKMLLIGGIFVFFSGFIYFLFMAAWLNLFLVMGQVAVITTIAGVVSLVIAGINIKDFFLFKQWVSLTIPDSAKLRLFDRMRKLLRSTSLLSTMIGAIVLAVAANFYELLCTAGFPMVFTRILTLNNLSTTTYYLYLVLYNIVYVIPMLIIVLGFTYTLGRRQLTEWQGRVLKLISGFMMLGLGVILLINPALLNSVLVSSIILMLALGVSLLVATVTKRLGY